MPSPSERWQWVLYVVIINPKSLFHTVITRTTHKSLMVPYDLQSIQSWLLKSVSRGLDQMDLVIIFHTLRLM